MTGKHDHFETEQWADFVRGQASSRFAREMQEHLDRGCHDCLHAAALWSGVAELARREEIFEAPAADVRCAKALYSIFPPRKEQSFRLSFAQLIGLNRLALEGVRGVAAPAGQYRFREGNVLVDLHLESALSPSKMFLVGQILDPGASEPGHPGNLVSLQFGKQAIAETTLNAFGEFYLEFVPRPDLLLMLELDPDSFLFLKVPVGEEMP